MKMMSVLAGVVLTLTNLAWASSPFEPVREFQVPSGMVYDIVQPPVENPNLFQGKQVALLASHGVEESEIVFPYLYLTARGAEVEVLVPAWTPEGIVASQFLKPTLFVKASGTFRSGLNKEYDLVVLTGGAWNAQVVRTDEDALRLVRNQYASGRGLAAICAGTSVLIDAGIARSVTLTGSPVVRIDLIHAGARYLDQPLVISNHLATSRSPNDLPAFVTGLRRLLIDN